jgi:fluoroacetyl-CoA thioesterase
VRDPAAAIVEDLIGEISVDVTAEMTAASFGNVDVDVIATPYLIWLLEGASVRAVQHGLELGQRTVGTMVNVRHVAAAFVGAHILARSRLIEIDGSKLVFEVRAYEGDRCLMSGFHERRIVERDRFLRRGHEKSSGI